MPTITEYRGRARVLGSGPAPIPRAVAKQSRSSYDDPLDVYSTDRARLLKGVVISGLRVATAAVPISVIVQAIQSGDPELADVDASTLDEMASEISASLLDQLGAAGSRTATGYTFNAQSQAAYDYATGHAADLVVQISDGMRDTLRGLISRAVADGSHPYDVAPLIRESGIGLPDIWANAVYNYWSGLMASGADYSQVQELTSGYYDRLLDLRSENIARTEILDAANQGKLEAWMQAGEAGLIGVDQSEKEWVAADDERTCPTCSDLDGEIVGLDELFSSGDDMPPAHPSCRCTAALLAVGGEQVGSAGGGDEEAV